MLQDMGNSGLVSCWSSSKSVLVVLITPITCLGTHTGTEHQDAPSTFSIKDSPCTRINLGFPKGKGSTESTKRSPKNLQLLVGFLIKIVMFFKCKSRIFKTNLAAWLKIGVPKNPHHFIMVGLKNNPCGGWVF